MRTVPMAANRNQARNQWTLRGRSGLLKPTSWKVSTTVQSVYVSKTASVVDIMKRAVLKTISCGEKLEKFKQNPVAVVT